MCLQKHLAICSTRHYADGWAECRDEGPADPPPGFIYGAYGVGSQVSVSMFTRVALILPLITGPAGVLPSGIKLAIVNVPV